ncbi:hypothetical protein, partial [Sansalvadorimonas verongulae]|uniref:hypothetical protein n=1 Tax=Sansalvadorimonas verongulae TaxID=2172824 RepID=UPI0018AD2DB6
MKPQNREFLRKPSVPVSIPVLGKKDRAEFESEPTSTSLQKRVAKEVCETKTEDILGRSFPVVTLPDNTPLLFQWFSYSEKYNVPDSYYENLERACVLEAGREIG